MDEQQAWYAFYSAIETGEAIDPKENNGQNIYLLAEKALKNHIKNEKLLKLGKLIEFPVLPNETVYVVEDDRYYKTKVHEITIEKDGITIFLNDEYTKSSFSGFGIEDFGDTVFLTEDEAKGAIE